MDLKSKGISWVGNIYQRFETMCHEVDNIVKKDTVKYVENHVNMVGENMKKFYSDVVQDLIPPIVDPVRCEAEAMGLKVNAVVGTCIKSTIRIEENHGTKDPMEQSLEELSDFDPMKKQPSNAFSGHPQINQSSSPTSGESFEGTESSTTLGKINDVSKNENFDSSTEDNAIKEKCISPEALDLISPHEKGSFNALPFIEFMDSTHENLCVSRDEVLPETSVHGDQSQSLQNLGVAATSVHEEEFQAPQKVGIVCYSPTDDSDSMSDASSTLALSETAFSVASTCGSIFTEPRTLPETSFDDIFTKVISYGNTVNVSGPHSDGFNVLSSSTSSPVVSCNSEVAETGFICSNSMLPSELTDCSSCSSCIGDDIRHCGMETIDLSNKLKLEESCVIVDNSMLYEVSRRTRMHRSYKKKIRDAFTSKRRLTKEYEQLAIWYGDLDIESSKDTVQGQLQSSTSITSDPDFRAQHTHESEWELL